MNSCTDCKHENQTCHLIRNAGVAAGEIDTGCVLFTPKPENATKAPPMTIAEIELMAANFVLEDLHFSLDNANIINRAIRIALDSDKRNVELKDILHRSGLAIKRLILQEREVIKELAKIK